MIDGNYVARVTPGLQVLSDDQKTRIHPIREGTPVVAAGSGMMTMDMSTLTAPYGAPAFVLDWCALCEMDHRRAAGRSGAAWLIAVA